MAAQFLHHTALGLPFATEEGEPGLLSDLAARFFGATADDLGDLRGDDADGPAGQE